MSRVRATDALKPGIGAALRRQAAASGSTRRLAFPKKVRAVVRLQEMAAPVLRRRGKKVPCE
jgi:hypothetical protein